MDDVQPASVEEFPFLRCARCGGTRSWPEIYDDGMKIELFACDQCHEVELEGVTINRSLSPAELEELEAAPENVALLEKFAAYMYLTPRTPGRPRPARTRIPPCGRPYG